MKKDEDRFVLLERKVVEILKIITNALENRNHGDSTSEDVDVDVRELGTYCFV